MYIIMYIYIYIESHTIYLLWFAIHPAPKLTLTRAVGWIDFTKGLLSLLMQISPILHCFERNNLWEGEPGITIQCHEKHQIPSSWWYRWTFQCWFDEWRAWTRRCCNWMPWMSSRGMPRGCLCKGTIEHLNPNLSSLLSSLPGSKGCIYFVTILWQTVTFQNFMPLFVSVLVLGKKSSVSPNSQTYKM